MFNAINDNKDPRPWRLDVSLFEIDVRKILGKVEYSGETIILTHGNRAFARLEPWTDEMKDESQGK